MVIIDNGHGFETPGKRSPKWPDGSQLFEYEFNRDIAKRVHEVLNAFGIICRMLVPEAVDVSLAERVRRANAIHAYEKDSVLVSIHANAGGGSGWEIFTSPGQTKSDELAEVFVEVAEANLTNFRIRKDESDGDADKEANFYLLHKTTCPAVLTENGFMDNEKDCRYLMSEVGRAKIAKVHVDAILIALNRKIFK